MAKFMVLYNSTVPPSEMMANATPEQMKASMDEWMAWAGRCGDAIVDLGSPVQSAKRITAGSASASDSQVAGFSVLQADSVDAVTAMLEGHPHLSSPGQPSIEVLEYLPMPGM